MHPKFESLEEKEEKFDNFLVQVTTRFLEIGKFEYLFLSNGDPVRRLEDIPLDEDLLFVSHLPNFVMIRPRREESPSPPEPIQHNTVEPAELSELVPRVNAISEEEEETLDMHTSRDMSSPRPREGTFSSRRDTM